MSAPLLQAAHRNRRIVATVMRRFSIAWLTCVAVLCGLCCTTSTHAAADSRRQVLVFSKTAGYRHQSIPAGLKAIEQIGLEDNFAVVASEDASAGKRHPVAWYRDFDGGRRRCLRCAIGHSRVHA